MKLYTVFGLGIVSVSFDVEKTKTKKDPLKPKGPKSAYMFYCAEHRPAAVDDLQEEVGEDEKVNFGDIGKTLGRWWKETSSEEKVEFEDLAKADKKRHAKEMETYTPPDPPSGSEESDGDNSPTKSKKKKPKKDPNMPKKAATAYILFSNATRAEIKEENPDLDNKEIMGELGRLWKELDDEDKDFWKEQSKELKVTRDAEIEAYLEKKASGEDDEALEDAAEQWSSDGADVVVDDSPDKVSKKMKSSKKSKKATAIN